MEQVPAATRVTTFPATVQKPVEFEAKAIARPAVDVAFREKGAVPNVTFPSAPKLIVCAALLTVKLRVTEGAAEYVALPGWLAIMEHIPAAMTVTVLADTVQTEIVVDAKLTASPELAVAVIGNGATPKVTFPSEPKVIV